MAGSMSSHLVGSLIDLVFRTGTGLTKPSVLAIALCKSAPTKSSTGATINEVSNAGSYARVNFSPSNAHWSAPVAENATTKNQEIILFPVATASWGIITHVAICDSVSYHGGSLLFWGALDIIKTVNSGDQFQFLVDTLAIKVT